MSEASELVMLIQALDNALQHCAVLEWKLSQANERLDAYEGIHVEDKHVAYGTKTYSGRCGSAVTKADIERKFASPYLGCANVTVGDGRFTITAYTD